MLRRTTKPLRRVLILVIEEGLAKSSKKQHSENTDKWHLWLCKAGSFSYSESLRTPPLEGTSLHPWNNSVERPWGILSLFTTCLQVQSPCHSPWHMWNTPPKQHTKKRGVIRNTKRPKLQDKQLGCGQKKCIKKTQRQAISMKALWNVKRSEITK